MNLKPVPVVDGISRDEFQKTYMDSRTPVVLKELASEWPATKKWTPEFWQEKHGDKEVPVYDASFAKPGDKYMSSVNRMPLKDYVSEVVSTERDLRMFLYNIMGKAPELYDDVILPDLADGFSKQFVFMFFGCKGSVTPIHIDIDMSHVFHTQFHGEKRCLLFSPEQNKNLYRHPYTVRSYVDPANPDYEKYPRLKEAEGYEVILKPGETLFIPCGWWHHMIYIEGGWAVSLRCTAKEASKRLEGLHNILVLNTIDRVMNKIAPQSWFDYKESRSRAA
ncbi:MAG: cupin-like domain-containing protein [Verrucomicrobiota bacterium]